MNWTNLLLLTVSVVPSSWHGTLLYKDMLVLGLISSAWFIQGDHYFTDLPAVKGGECVVQPAEDPMQKLCLTESTIVSWNEVEGGVVVSVSKKSPDWEVHLQDSATNFYSSNVLTNEIKLSIRTTSLAELHADLLSQGMHNNWQLLLNDKSTDFMLLSWRQGDGTELTQSAHLYTKEHVILSEVRSSP